MLTVVWFTSVKDFGPKFRQYFAEDGVLHNEPIALISTAVSAHWDAPIIIP